MAAPGQGSEPCQSHPRSSRRGSPSHGSWRACCRAVLVAIEPIPVAILGNRRRSRRLRRISRSSARATPRSRGDHAPVERAVSQAKRVVAMLRSERLHHRNIAPSLRAPTNVGLSNVGARRGSAGWRRQVAVRRVHHVAAGWHLQAGRTTVSTPPPEREQDPAHCDSDPRPTT